MDANALVAAGFDGESRRQISLRIPEKLLTMLDRISGGNRSAYIIKALERQLALEEQKACIKRISGTFSPDSFDNEDAIVYVNKLRKGSRK